MLQKFKKLKRIERAGDARALNFSCFENRPFLRSERACGWLGDAVKRSLKAHHCELWAYCFMPTHVHLLVLPRSEQPDISAFLEPLKKSVTAKAVAWLRANAPDGLKMMRDEQPNGRVSLRFWQRGGGYDRNLWSPRAIWNMIEYIHSNPVEDGLCATPGDWKWSSAGYYATKVEGVLPVEMARVPWDPR